MKEEYNFAGALGNNAEFVKIHIGAEVRKELYVQKRTINWLADEIGCDQSNLRKKLKKRYINPPLLHRISEVLQVDFFAIYSQSLSFRDKVE